MSIPDDEIKLVYYTVNKNPGLQYAGRGNVVFRRFMGMYEGAKPPSYEIRSSDMRERGTEACATSGGNRQAKRGKSQGAAESRDYVSSPEGCKLLPISFSGRVHST